MQDLEVRQAVADLDIGPSRCMKEGGTWVRRSWRRRRGSAKGGGGEATAAC